MLKIATLDALNPFGFTAGASATMAKIGVVNTPGTLTQSASTTIGFNPTGLPTLTTYSTAGAYTYTIPRNCSFIDVICLGGGKGGESGGAAFTNGGGGQAGQWATSQITRGTTISWSVTSITGTVGAGSAGGVGSLLNISTSGESSTAAATGWGGLTASGGTVSYRGSSDDGQAAGTTTFNTRNYVGGNVASAFGQDGWPPGGGGAGNSGGLFGGNSPGGAGATGSVWIYAY